MIARMESIAYDNPLYDSSGSHHCCIHGCIHGTTTRAIMDIQMR